MLDVARLKPRSLPCFGCLTIVSSTLSPFGSEHASTTECGRVGGGLGADAQAVGRELRARARRSRRSRSRPRRRAGRRPLTARPRGSSSARVSAALERGLAPHAASDAEGRGERAGRRIELQRDDRVLRATSRPRRRGCRAARPRRAARGPSVEAVQPGGRGGAGDARDARQDAVRRVAPEREHRVVVGARDEHGGAVGRDRDRGGAGETADDGAVGERVVAQAALSGLLLGQRARRSRHAGTRSASRRSR